MTFLRTRVRNNKINEFCDLEENPVRLARRKQMSDLISFVLNEEQRQKSLDCFDGTSRFGEALTIILCIVGHNHQRLVRVQLQVKT